MTVKELIVQLSEYPEQAEVWAVIPCIGEDSNDVYISGYSGFNFRTVLTETKSEMKIIRIEGF